MTLYGAETWRLLKADYKYFENFEMWCWRRMTKIRWMDRVKNGEVLHGVKEERNNLNIIKRKQASCIGHILRRNCSLKHVFERNIGGTRR